MHPKLRASKMGREGWRGKQGPNNGWLDFILRIKGSYCKVLGREMKQHKYHVFNIDSSQLSVVIWKIIY